MLREKNPLHQNVLDENFWNGLIELQKIHQAKKNKTKQEKKANKQWKKCIEDPEMVRNKMRRKIEYFDIYYMSCNTEKTLSEQLTYFWSVVLSYTYIHFELCFSNMFFLLFLLLLLLIKTNVFCALYYFLTWWNTCQMLNVNNDKIREKLFDLCV